MSKVAISGLLTVLIGGFVAGGAVLKSQLDRSAGSTDRLVDEVSSLRTQIEGLRKETTGLTNRLARMETSQSVLATQMATPAIATDPDAAAPAPAAAVAAPADLKTYIMSALDEREKIQQEQREQEREEMRQQMEQRREELAQMREGPYDRYNLKVNSLASVLSMDDGQKQAYYELVQAYDQKWDAAREKMREEARARAEAAAAANGGQAPQEEGGRRGRGGRGGFFGGDREAYRQLSDSIQQEFAASVPRILTTAQLEVYNNLSDSAKSFQNAGYVSAPGEENQFGRMFGGDRGGFRGMRGGR